MVGIYILFGISFFIPIIEGSFSLYGVAILVYFGHQLWASGVNHLAMEETAKKMSVQDSSLDVVVSPSFPSSNIVLADTITALLVVGYREDAEYWKQCIQSVRDHCLSDDNLHHLLIVIDGHDEEDRYMQEIACEILQHHLPTLEEVRESASSFAFLPRIEIKSISHRGKRGCLYFGLERIRRSFRARIADLVVVVTDSDTVLYQDSIPRLRECLFSAANIGCATGCLTIHNRSDGILPKIIESRYQYAFRIERGAASLYHCMTCCSGPLSIYRMACLDESITKRFITQSFFDVGCEPGDDRHLTNLILSQGYGARQTNLAVAGTEAPVTLSRFLRQQLRWSRSYYRELYWQLKSLARQSLYLGIMTIYETSFPLFVACWTLYSLFLSPYQYHWVYGLAFSIGTAMLKSIILTLSLRPFQPWICAYQLVYFFLYFTCLLPLKFFAMITVCNNRWVTSPRQYPLASWLRDLSWDWIWILGWNVLLLCGLSYQMFFLTLLSST